MVVSAGSFRAAAVHSMLVLGLKRVANLPPSYQASAQLFKGDAAHLVDELIRCSQLKPAALPHLEGRELVPWTDDSVVPGAGFLPLENRCVTLSPVLDVQHEAREHVSAWSASLSPVRGLSSQRATAANVAC